MRNNDQIIAYLEQQRRKQHLSISEVARRVGMAKSSVSLYFNKTRELPLNKAGDFAKAVGVTEEELLGLDKNPVASRVASHVDPDTPPTEEKQIISFIENLKIARD